MNTVNFLAGQNILWSIFCVSSETIFQQFTVFIKAELTQVFEMLRGKKCLGGRRVGRIWEANALLHYLWWIDNNNCGTLAGEAVEQNMWNELHLLIHLIYNALWKLISGNILKYLQFHPRLFILFVTPLLCWGR